MVHEEHQGVSKAFAMGTLQMAIGIGTVILVSGTFVVLAPRTASAKPEFAAQTGLPCGQCHVNPAGGGKLKSFGQKFKANGYKLKK